jgi:hypothetical protein
MTDHPCNCSTCESYKQKQLGKNGFCPEYLIRDSPDCEGREMVSDECGLMCHSKSREYLMKDVIKDLGRLKDEKRISINIDDVIDLIRNGVKKE